MKFQVQTISYNANVPKRASLMKVTGINKSINATDVNHIPHETNPTHQHSKVSDANAS